MSSLPDNYFGKLRKLENYAKQSVKIYPDRTGTINSGDTIQLTLPKNTLVHLDSFLMYFKGTTNSIGSYTDGEDTAFISRFFQRNTASIIDTLSVSINGQRICSINEYGHLYNLLYDMSSCIENNCSGKRSLENTDPSTKSSINTATDAITRIDMIYPQATDATDKNSDFVISQGLGFMGSSSSRVIDTGVLGEVQIEIRLSSPDITWYSATPAGSQDYSGDAINDATYSISDVFFTIDRITFNDPTYYELQAAGLNSDGIPIAFKTYSSHKGALGSKSLNHSFNVNSQKLNKLIGTCFPDDYDAIGNLQITGSGTPAASGRQNFLTAVIDGKPDIFHQSLYFQKDCVGIQTSQFEVNNVATTPAPLTQKEIFNHNMIALGIKDDMNGGIHAGCYDLNAWSKDYLSHIVDFNHQQNSSDFWLEGLDGRSSSLNCKWKTVASGSTTLVYPLVYAEMTKLMNVSAGQQISVIY